MHLPARLGRPVVSNLPFACEHFCPSRNQLDRTLYRPGSRARSSRTRRKSKRSTPRDGCASRSVRNGGATQLPGTCARNRPVGPVVAVTPRTAGPSGTVVFFQPPQSLQETVSFAGLVPVNRKLLDRFTRGGSVMLLPLERIPEHAAQMLGTRKAIGFELGQAPIRPPGGDLVCGLFGACRMRACDVNGLGHGPVAFTRDRGKSKTKQTALRRHYLNDSFQNCYTRRVGTSRNMTKSTAPVAFRRPCHE
jgi:hypothetical protein